jgi:hypothetical protein
MLLSWARHLNPPPLLRSQASPATLRYRKRTRRDFSRKIYHSLFVATSKKPRSFSKGAREQSRAIEGFFVLNRLQTEGKRFQSFVSAKLLPRAWFLQIRHFNGPARREVHHKCDHDLVFSGPSIDYAPRTNSPDRGGLRLPTNRLCRA